MVLANNLSSKLLDEQNETLADEIDKTNRAKNLIIHGREETDAAGDELFAKDLFKDLEIRPPPISYIERIGTKLDSEQRPAKRPIKIAFRCEEDKNKVFDNLSNLKGKLSYKGICITNDYTFSQRLLIKEFRGKAERKNREEEQNRTNCIWKVRGTPETGLMLKRFNTS